MRAGGICHETTYFHERPPHTPVRSDANSVFGSSTSSLWACGAQSLVHPIFEEIYVSTKGTKTN